MCVLYVFITQTWIWRNVPGIQQTIKENGILDRNKWRENEMDYFRMLLKCHLEIFFTCIPVWQLAGSIWLTNFEMEMFTVPVDVDRSNPAILVSYRISIPFRKKPFTLTIGLGIDRPLSLTISHISKRDLWVIIYALFAWSLNLTCSNIKCDSFEQAILKDNLQFGNRKEVSAHISMLQSSTDPKQNVLICVAAVPQSEAQKILGLRLHSYETSLSFRVRFTW